MYIITIYNVYTLAYKVLDTMCIICAIANLINEGRHLRTGKTIVSDKSEKWHNILLHSLDFVVFFFSLYKTEL